MAGPYPPGHCNLVLAEDQKCCRCGCGYVFAPAAVTRIRFNHNMSTNHGGTTVYKRHLLPARELRDLRARARGASPKNSKICKMQRKKEKKKKRKKIAMRTWQQTSGGGHGNRHRQQTSAFVSSCHTKDCDFAVVVDDHNADSMVASMVKFVRNRGFRLQEA